MTRARTAVALVAFALLVSAPSVRSALAQEADLRIMVLEGDDRVNIVERGATVPTRVEVLDAEGRPLSGATVRFQFEEDDPATLNDGQRQVTLTTNAQGQAAVVVSPVASGAAPLSVTVTSQGRTVTVVIIHTNFATVAEAEAAGVGVPDDAGGETAGDAGGETAGDAGETGGEVSGAASGGSGEDGGLGTGALVGILGGAGAAVGVGVAVAGGGSSSFPPVFIPPSVPSASVPSAPSRPTLTAGDRELGVRWNAPADGGEAITDYDVRYRRSGSGGWTELLGEFLNLRATISRLTNDTAYEVQVRAGNSVGKGSWSASATGTPMAAAIGDQAVLIELYNATNGTNWTNNTNWNSSAPLDQWHGVSTDGNGRVTELWLGGNGLTGSIPSSLGSLTNLRTLYFRDNQLSGSIPSSLGSLTNLRRLYFRDNQLTGSIPSSLSSLTNLNDLDFHGNQLTGSIPSFLGSLTNLGSLWLSSNQLTGSIPSSLGSLTNLYSLALAGNELTGSIPSSLSNLTNLYSLFLHGNQLTGSIPSFLGSLTGLARLFLHDNQLTGSIPDSLGSLRSLHDLYLHNNQLSGSIPAALCQFEEDINPQQGGVNLPCEPSSASGDRAVLIEFYSATNGANWIDNTNWNTGAPLDQWHGVSTDANGHVTALSLSDNQLTGSIPSSLGSLTNLTYLELYENQLTSIPSELGNLKNLTWLGLFDNQLTSIPPTLGNLTNLETLEIGNNQLAGSIPPALGNLTNLTYLALPNNQLNGSIPSTFGNLANLETLYLFYNQLTGSIPSELGDLTNLNTLELQYNQLTGSIPAALCRFTINPQQGDVYLPCASSSATAQSLAALSVSDALAEEAVGAAVAFAVTLSGAAADPVTVDYATRDGSARAGEDYTAASGTLTFAAGESSKTVEVEVLDDAHDEGEETFVLALSNASGARLEDADATGTIQNTDLMPAALLARFGRATAEQVVEHIEQRMAAPRERGFRARLAGREFQPGMERDFAFGFLSQFGQPMGVSPMMGATGMGANPMGAASRGATPMGAHLSGHGAGVPGMTGMTGTHPSMVGAAAPTGYGPSDGAYGGVLGSMLPGDDLFSNSEFELNREQRGGVVSVWSRSSRSHFGGLEGALSLNGVVRTTMLGADYTRGPLVVGLSVGRTLGLGGYGGRSAGQMTSSMTGFYPWLGYQVNDRVSVWGVTGYGTGALSLTPDGAGALETGMSMAMTAAGTRGELIGSGATGGFALAFKADALWVGAATDLLDGEAGRLNASQAGVTRLRTALEGSRSFTVGGRLSLTPSVEVGLRQDGGDAETGTGIDVGGGLVFTDTATGLSLDVRMRTLVLHQADGFTERGMSLSFGWDPTPSSPLGLTARVAPSWGGSATGGAESLWNSQMAYGAGSHGMYGSGGQVNAEVGYGLPAGRFVGTPRVGLTTSEYGRAYRLGYGLGLLGGESVRFELGVDAQRRENPMLGDTDNGVLGRASLGW